MIELIQPEVPNLAALCLKRGAIIKDLIVPTESLWPGLCNPSIFNDDGDLKLVLRNVNYIMHASYYENKNWSEWGPLQYLIPRQDWAGRHLRTRNYICNISDDCIMTDYHMVNTSKYDKPPKWEFVGHEDARLVRWDDNLYMTGVRRDDNTNGTGRMSLCKIDDKYNEVQRKKIDRSDLGYCEKNWMPIIDKPYHYVRTTLPVTEIVKVDPKTGTCTNTTRIEQEAKVSHDMMVRGSSQVIPWKGKHIALTHTCNLYINENGKKYSRYHYHFVVWDENWKIEAISPLFTFSDFNIEFSNGLALKDGKFYIPFALQDNMAFLMCVDDSVIEEFIYNRTISSDISYDMPDTHINRFFLNSKDVSAVIDLAFDYYKANFKAGAYCLFQRALDFGADPYVYLFWMGRSIADLGNRDPQEFYIWWTMIDIQFDRPEAWMALHMYYKYRQDYDNAYHTALMAHRFVSRRQFYYDRELYDIELAQMSMLNEHRDSTIAASVSEDVSVSFKHEVESIMSQQQQIKRIL